MKWKIKPFTLFMAVFTLLFLAFFPLWFRYKNQNPPEDPFAKEMPKWSGVITLWDIPYVRTGKGNSSGWLGSYIKSFEKKYPGVFIDVRSMTAERLAMYLHGEAKRDILPDMISLGVYDQLIPESYLVDLSEELSEEERMMLREPSLKRVQSGDKIIGIPWMMGSYGLYVNQDILIDESGETISESLDYNRLDTLARKGTFQKKSGKRTITHYGFCTYNGFHSKPLLSMIYQEGVRISDNKGMQLLEGWKEEVPAVSPPNMTDMSYSNALRMFSSDKRSSILLGDSKVLFDLRNQQKAGKGVEFQLFPLPLEEDSDFYMDQIAAYGLLRQSNAEKNKLCVLFLKGLLEQEVQAKLADIGMFSVCNDLALYSEDPQMKALEAALDRITSGPFGENGKLAEDFWREVME